MTYNDNLEPRENTFKEKFDILESYKKGLKIEKRPIDKIVIIKNNSCRLEYFNRKPIKYKKRKPVYKDDEGNIEFDNIDHIEEMFWENCETDNFDFDHYQYRVVAHIPHPVSLITWLE